MGILARSLPGNLSIWREIVTFEINKYIRNSGKSDFLAGKIIYTPEDTKTKGAYQSHFRWQGFLYA